MSKQGQQYTDAQIAAANAEWQGLLNDLSSAEQRIRKIIENKLWLPIGYTTFTQAWEAKLADSDLGTRALRYVVYQMLNEGRTTEEIASDVDGIGIPTAEALKADKDAGVPAAEASTRVRSHPRVLRPHTLHLYVGAENLDQLHQDCDVLGLSVMSTALTALEKHMKELHEDAQTKIRAWREAENAAAGNE